MFPRLAITGRGMVLAGHHLAAPATSCQAAPLTVRNGNAMKLSRILGNKRRADFSGVNQALRHRERFDTLRE